MILLRRIVFISALLFVTNTSSVTLICILSIIQLAYVVNIIILRPFEEIKSNVIDILNEVYYLMLLSTFIFYNTKESWSTTKISIYIWTLTSDSMMIFLIILVDTIKMMISKCRKRKSTIPAEPPSIPFRLSSRYIQPKIPKPNKHVRHESNQDQNVSYLQEESKLSINKKYTNYPIYSKS